MLLLVVCESKPSRWIPCSVHSVDPPKETLLLLLLLLSIFSRSLMCGSLVAFAAIITPKRKPSAITHFTDIKIDKLPFAGTGNSCGFPERGAGPASNQDYESLRVRKH